MCESLPLDRPYPKRLGNELLCRYCRAGDCERCVTRQSTATYCEHPCGWLPYIPPSQRRPR